MTSDDNNPNQANSRLPGTRTGTRVPFALNGDAPVSAATADQASLYRCPICRNDVFFDPNVDRMGAFFHRRPVDCDLDVPDRLAEIAASHLRKHLDAVVDGKAHFPWITHTCECGAPVFRELTGAFNTVRRLEETPEPTIEISLVDAHDQPRKRMLVIILTDWSAVEALHVRFSSRSWIAVDARLALRYPGAWGLDSEHPLPIFNKVAIPSCPVCSSDVAATPKR